ncbi:AAA domain containing protein [Elaphomyces granulatus]
MSEEAQLPMLRLAEAVQTASHERYYGLPELSIEAHVVRATEAAKQEDQIALLKGHISFEDVVEFKGPEVDMFEELHSHLNHMKIEPISEWQQEDKSKSLIAFKASRILVSTNNNTASNICAQHFAQDAKAVILFRDEDPKELEVNAWIPLTKTVFSSKIAGVVISGDTRQLEPTVLTANEEPGWNEFSQQLQTSHAARLMKAYHPVLKLTEQRRFRDTFAEFLNRRIYKGEMKSHAVTKDITVNPQWDKMIRHVFPAIRDPNFDAGHFVLSIENSACQIDPSTKSRYNFAHVEAVVSLLLHNHKFDGYRGDEVKIITPYSAQHELPIEYQPSVETIDSMQGREAKVVIIDWTISEADRPGDLGFTSDNHRCNVAHSRMVEVLIDVIPMKVASGTLANKYLERLDSFGEVVQSKRPYLCEYVQWAAQKQMVIETEKIDNTYSRRRRVADCLSYKIWSI